MNEENEIAAPDRTSAPLDRRGFFRTAGAGFGAAGLLLTRESEASADLQPQWSEKDKLARIASCSYPIRYIFKTRPGAGRGGGPAPACGQSGGGRACYGRHRGGCRKRRRTGTSRRRPRQPGESQA